MQKLQENLVILLNQLFLDAYHLVQLMMINYMCTGGSIKAVELIVNTSKPDKGCS